MLKTAHMPFSLKRHVGWRTPRKYIFCTAFAAIAVFTILFVRSPDTVRARLPCQAFLDQGLERALLLEGAHNSTERPLPSPSVAVATLSLYGPKQWFHHWELLLCEQQNKRRYCDLHDLDLYTETLYHAMVTEMLPTRPWMRTSYYPMFQKLRYLEWFTRQKCQMYDWLLWVDSDIYFMNFNIDVRDRLAQLLDEWHSLSPQRPDPLVIVADDGNGLNNGIFFLRNTPEANQFMAQAFHTEVNVFNDPSGWSDQVAFVQVIEGDWKLRSQAFIVPHQNASLLQTQWLHREGQTGTQYRPGDFILHLSGYTLEGRAEIVKHVTACPWPKEEMI